MFPGRPREQGRGASLRLYFDDAALHAAYLDKTSARRAAAARWRSFMPQHEDFYAQVSTRSAFVNAALDASRDHADGGENIAPIENCERNELAHARCLVAPLRRRRVPARARSDSAATLVIGESAPDRTLIEAVKRNDAETVDRIMKQGGDPNLKYTLNEREAYDLRFIFGTPEMTCAVEWSVLHAAAALGHWRCARALLDHGADVNAVAGHLAPLDVAGAAYHYTRLLPQDLVSVTQTLLDAGGAFADPPERTARGTPLHTAAAAESVAAVQLLLDADADVACRDTEGLTPLHVCLKNESAKVLHALVNYNCLSAEELRARLCATDAHGVSALQAAAAAGWRAGARVLLDAGADLAYCADHDKARLWRSPHWDRLLQSRLTPLHLAVERDDADMLKMMIDRLPSVETLNCQNGDGETPLFTAIKHGKLRSVETLVFEGASIQTVSIKGHNALHVAAEYERTDIMKFLLEFEDDVVVMINCYNGQGCAPLHVAAMENNTECVKMLVQNDADIRLKTVGHDSFTALHIAAGYNHVSLAKTILELDKTTIDEVDGRRFSPLHVAIRNCCQAVMMLLLNNGATLAGTTKAPSKETTAIEMLSNKLPNPVEFLEEVFDSYVTSENAFAKTKITVNYEILGKANEAQQMRVIEELVRCGQEKVLIHPLLESLLYLKWQTLLPFFYVILATYAFFVLSLNILVVSVFYYIDRKGSPPDYLNQQVWNILLVISIFLLLIQEYFYISVKRDRYLTYAESWVKLGSIVLAIIFSGTMWLSAGPAEWARHLATAALALAWAEVLFLLSRFPNWGYYVLMFGNVAVTIIKILLTFTFLLVAFSLCFMLQFRAAPPFAAPAAALLKTLVMMTSEFDYVALFHGDTFKTVSTSNVIVGLLFLCYLVSVSVVLMNFMVGVAVSDITALNVRGNTKRLAKLVELLSTLDVVVHESPLRELLPRGTFDKINERRFIRKMTTFPGSEKTWSVVCGDGAHESHDGDYDVRLPKSLAGGIIQRANRHAARQENRSSDRVYLDKIDALYEAVMNENQTDQQSVNAIKDLDAKMEKLTTEFGEIKQIQTESLRKIDKLLEML